MRLTKFTIAIIVLILIVGGFALTGAIARPI
jgi:hypothetical protein